ncbi:isopenicillin N synthase family dioxygenase [Dongia deserti]|uniref:isopenicillin N synthase family dioxygenase n=1 Tax=Dongia deserti TaxID=2268030 RepID=UPI000E658F88|nr:2OG-Fe(II) oxygenase family protein [Dongia deserti]
MVPRIDISALFSDPADRAKTDVAILGAASSIGFMTVCGLPADVPIGARSRRALLRLFDLPPAETRKLWRQKFDASHRNVYRGWFPLQNGFETYKEGIDIGPDIAFGADVVDPRDPLREPTPLPPDSALPGWRAAAAAYFVAMERVAQALMRALARGLGLREGIFDDAFARGISTLRLIHYPVRPPESMIGVPEDRLWVTLDGQRHYLLGRTHVDSGLMTLLAQDGVPGLQARAADGAWIDIPPEEGTLAVNFGKLLEKWTGGRIKATEHRVIGRAEERFSIPFFHDARADALIEPLPLPGIEPFTPFYFGDYLWSTMTKFVEFQGLEGLRRPQGR